MRSRLTILAAVFLLAALAMPHTVEAQGFTVGKATGIEKVIESGNNQLLPNVTLTYDTEPESTAPIQRSTSRDQLITIKFGDLPITNVTAWTTATQALNPPIAGDFVETGDPGGAPTELQWKWSTGGKQIQIYVTSGTTLDNLSTIILADLRLDVSSLDDGAPVPIMVSASDSADLIDLGSSGPGSVNASLVTAADGLTVTGVKASGLSCGLAATPTVTVMEGFAGAWHDMGRGGVEDPISGNFAQIRLEVSNFPDSEEAKIHMAGYRSSQPKRGRCRRGSEPEGHCQANPRKGRFSGIRQGRNLPVFSA